MQSLNIVKLTRAAEREFCVSLCRERNGAANIQLSLQFDVLLRKLTLHLAHLIRDLYDLLKFLKMRLCHSRCDPNPFCSGLACTHSGFGCAEWQFYYLANRYFVRVRIPLYSKNNSPQ